MTTLLESRARGDLIEAFRVISGIANYGGNFFTYNDNNTRSGLHLVMSSTSSTGNSQDFFSRRVIRYWNILPAYVKTSETVNHFKSNLASCKKQYFNKPGNYWELSQEIYNRAGNDDRHSYCEYMLDHPYIAKRKGINIH